MDKETDVMKNKLDSLSILMNTIQKRLISKNKTSSSHKAGEKGIELILNNDFIGALQYFKQALTIDPTDDRHYLNRSYCYLKMRNYALSLADLSHILEKSDVPAHLFIANLRSGQAASGLKEYKKAESFFKAAISIDLENPYPKRELMRLKINCLVNAGYSEREALSILEKSSIIDDVLNSTENLQAQNDLQISNNLNDDLVYSSDDEDSSNTKILNRILNYEPGKIKLDHIANKLSTVSKTNLLAILNSNSKIESKKPKPFTKQAKSHTVEKESPLYFDDTKTLGVSNPINKTLTVNNYAIWVGNVENEMTDLMLRGLFSQYGCITKVQRPPNSNYAFIYFLDDKPVKSILQYNYYHLNGRTLAVGPAMKSVT